MLPAFRSAWTISALSPPGEGISRGVKTDDIFACPAPRAAVRDMRRAHGSALSLDLRLIPRLRENAEERSLRSGVCPFFPRGSGNRFLYCIPRDRKGASLHVFEIIYGEGKGFFECIPPHSQKFLSLLRRAESLPFPGFGHPLQPGIVKASKPAQLAESGEITEGSKISLRPPEESSSMLRVREKFAGKNASSDEHVTPPCGFSSTKSKTEPKPSLVMKPIIPFALLGALFAVGAAQAASTTPVGYETNAFAVGFTPVGLRLHSPVVASGTLSAVSATTLTDSDVADFAAVLGASGSSGTYVLEINNGTGIYQLITTWSGSSINVADDLSGEVAADASYTIRKAATLASVFGATNNVANDGAGLGAGAGGPASLSTIDQVWVPNGAGNYDKYYFDNNAPPTFATASWAKVDNSTFGATAIDPNSVVLAYPVGMFVNAKTAGDLVVTGEVKKTATEVDLLVGFNAVGTAAPASATLTTAFGAANEAGLGAGAGGPASLSTIDQVWIPNGPGNYDKYYFDNNAPPTFATASWAKVDNSTFGATAVDGATVNLPSAIFINAKTAKVVTQGVPASYNSL